MSEIGGRKKIRNTYFQGKRKRRESSPFKLVCKFNNFKNHNNCGLLELTTLYRRVTDFTENFRFHKKVPVRFQSGGKMSEQYYRQLNSYGL